MKDVEFKTLNSLREDKEKEKEEEFNKLNSQCKKESDSFEIKTTNVLFSFMSVLSIIGTILIVIHINDILEPLKKNNPTYQFPSVYDFKITLISLIIFCVK
jgi:hypothetical protein